jgi:hypothetical protein
MLLCSPIWSTGRFLVSGRIGTSRTLSHGRQLSQNEKDRLRRYSTEGKEKVLKYADVELVLCIKNAKP